MGVVVAASRLYRPDGEALSCVWACLISLKLYFLFFFLNLFSCNEL